MYVFIPNHLKLISLLHFFNAVFSLLGYKRHHFVLKDLQLAAYRDIRDYEAMGGGAPAFVVCLKVSRKLKCFEVFLSGFLFYQ